MNDTVLINTKVGQFVLLKKNENIFYEYIKNNDINILNLIKEWLINKIQK